MYFHENMTGDIVFTTADVDEFKKCCPSSSSVNSDSDQIFCGFDRSHSLEKIVSKFVDAKSKKILKFSLFVYFSQ